MDTSEYNRPLQLFSGLHWEVSIVTDQCADHVTTAPGCLYGVVRLAYVKCYQ